MEFSYLEYNKIVLERVSFDPSLFRKEYRKALNLLNQKDRYRLKMWCKENITVRQTTA